MCKFLLEKGADPDYIAIPYDSIRLWFVSLHVSFKQTYAQLTFD